MAADQPFTMFRGAIKIAPRANPEVELTLRHAHSLENFQFMRMVNLTGGSTAQVTRNRLPSRVSKAYSHDAPLFGTPNGLVPASSRDVIPLACAASSASAISVRHSRDALRVSHPPLVP